MHLSQLEIVHVGVHIAKCICLNFPNVFAKIANLQLLELIIKALRLLPVGACCWSNCCTCALSSTWKHFCGSFGLSWGQQFWFSMGELKEMKLVKFGTLCIIALDCTGFAPFGIENPHTQTFLPTVCFGNAFRIKLHTKSCITQGPMSTHMGKHDFFSLFRACMYVRYYSKIKQKKLFLRPRTSSWSQNFLFQGSFAKSK